MYSNRKNKICLWKLHWQNYDSDMRVRKGC